MVVIFMEVVLKPILVYSLMEPCDCFLLTIILPVIHGFLKQMISLAGFQFRRLFHLEKLQNGHLQELSALLKKNKTANNAMAVRFAHLFTVIKENIFLRTQRFLLIVSHAMAQGKSMRISCSMKNQ